MTDAFVIALSVYYSSRYRLRSRMPATPSGGGAFTPGYALHYRSSSREVALTYRRARRTGKGQNEAVDAAIIEYRRLKPGRDR